VWNETANGSGRTDSNGQYDIGSLPAGTYQASFVDCADQPTHGGTTSSGVVVISEKKTKLNIELSNAPTGAISGHLTTEFGTPLEGACVAVLSGLSGDPRFTGPTGSDGAYQVDDLGTGSYFVGFFGCNEDNPAAPILDPAHPETTYQAQWYSNAPLGQQPDPFGDGATAVDVVSDQTTVVDECFDSCNNTIWITSAEAGDQTVTIDYRSTVEGAPVAQGLVSAAAADPAATQALPEYVATCTSSDGGVTGVASSGESPIVVADLTNGSTYTCVVATTVGRTTYVSAATTALVPQSTDPPVVPAAGEPPAAASPAPASPAPSTTPAASTNAALAFTGADATLRLGVLGLTMLLVGAVALFVARRRRPERA
jgi:hypothetical protein